MKNYGDAIGNRTRDLPAGGAVHQQTASTSVPASTHEAIIFVEESSEILDPAWRQFCQRLTIRFVACWLTSGVTVLCV